MRREFRSELDQLKHKEAAFVNEISFLKQELNLLRIPDPPTPPIATPSPRFLPTTETTGYTPLISNIKPSSAYAIPQPTLSNIVPSYSTKTRLTPPLTLSTPPIGDFPVSPTILNLIKNLKPTPAFTIPPYDPKDSKNWLVRVIGLLAGSDFFSILLMPDKSSLIPVCPESGISANIILYTRLTKALTTEQLTILTGDSTDPSSIASGLSILHCIASASTIELTTAQARIKWISFESVALGKNEPLATYTVRVIQGSKTLEGKKYAQTLIQRNIKWRLGLGASFAFINDSINILGSIPTGWGDNKNIFHLPGTATKFPPDTK